MKWEEYYSNYDIQRGERNPKGRVHVKDDDEKVEKWKRRSWLRKQVVSLQRRMYATMFCSISHLFSQTGRRRRDVRTTFFLDLRNTVQREGVEEKRRIAKSEPRLTFQHFSRSLSFSLSRPVIYGPRETRFSFERVSGFSGRRTTCGLQSTQKHQEREKRQPLTASSSSETSWLQK